MYAPRRTDQAIQTAVAVAAALFASACTLDLDPDDDDKSVEEMATIGGSPATGTAGGASSTSSGGADVDCPHDESVDLPRGFCATIFADDLGPARHMAVTPAGDVFVAINHGDEDPGQIVALRDRDHDGVADEREHFGDRGGNGIAWSDGQLFVAEDSRILQYSVPDGELLPNAPPRIVVNGLPDTGDHTAKTVVIGPGGDLFVNIGSASNSCQEDNRAVESPGIDPCPEIETRAGVWRFDAQGIEQPLFEGHHFAIGVRNANALAFEPRRGKLWAAQNGRDDLHVNWPEVFPEEEGLRLPSEEILVLEDETEYGWPYCYHDPTLGLVLAPEYGGDGATVGMCSVLRGPEAVLPAHWAPLGIHFYRGRQFPSRYQGGMFVANHGSRFEPDAEEPPGYSVVFIPFIEGRPSGPHQSFATGFAGDARPLPDKAEHRPVGLAELPDGSLLVSDDAGGRIWQVHYVGA
jgi:glucose/arabinose dehydrogenase